MHKTHNNDNELNNPDRVEFADLDAPTSLSSPTTRLKRWLNTTLTRYSKRMLLVAVLVLLPVFVLTQFMLPGLQTSPKKLTSGIVNASITKLALAKNVIYMEVSHKVVKAVHANDGSEMWSRELSSLGAFAGNDNYLFSLTAIADGTRFSALRARDGSVAWQQDSYGNTTFKELKLIGDKLYVVTTGGMLKTYAAYQPGLLLWQYSLPLFTQPNQLYSGSEHIPSLDELLYVELDTVALNLQTSLVLLHGATGQKIVSYTPDIKHADDFHTILHWPPLISRSYAYIHTNQDTIQVYALSAGSKDGLVTEYRIPEYPYTSIDEAYGIIYIVSSHSVRALLGYSGKQIWEYPLDPFTTTVLKADQNTVYLTVDRQSVTALHTFDGHKLWTRSTQHMLYFPDLTNGLLYFRYDQQTIQAWTGRNGQPAWTFHLPSPIFWQPLVHNDTMYIRNSNGTLTALSMYNGAVLWEHAG